MKRPDDLEKLHVEMGTHHLVIVEKMFGPMIACDLRIWVDNATCEWVIERERIQPGPTTEVNGILYGEDVITYEEVVRIPAQESIHFRGDDE